MKLEELHQDYKSSAIDKITKISRGESSTWTTENYCIRDRVLKDLSYRCPSAWINMKRNAPQPPPGDAPYIVNYDRYLRKQRGNEADNEDSDSDCARNLARTRRSTKRHIEAKLELETIRQMRNEPPKHQYEDSHSCRCTSTAPCVQRAYRATCFMNVWDGQDTGSEPRSALEQLSQQQQDDPMIIDSEQDQGRFPMDDFKRRESTQQPTSYTTGFVLGVPEPAGLPATYDPNEPAGPPAPTPSYGPMPAASPRKYQRSPYHKVKGKAHHLLGPEDRPSDESPPISDSSSTSTQTTQVVTEPPQQQEQEEAIAEPAMKLKRIGKTTIHISCEDKASAESIQNKIDSIQHNLSLQTKQQ